MNQKIIYFYIKVMIWQKIHILIQISVLFYLQPISIENGKKHFELFTLLSQKKFLFQMNSMISNSKSCPQGIEIEVGRNKKGLKKAF